MFKKHIKSKRRNKGQSTVEYIILVSAILAALLVFLSPAGPFRAAFDNAVTTGTDGMEDMAGRLANSR